MTAQVQNEYDAIDAIAHVADNDRGMLVLQISTPEMHL